MKLDISQKTKFKVGDWIVFNGLVLFIKEVVQVYYRTISVGGIPNSYDWDIDNVARLWTIEDARPGDVLAEDPWSDYPSSFVAIYKKQNEEDFDSYCFIGFNGKFYEGEMGHSTEYIHPATKEQCDILFKEMKKAGYEWDAENLQLTKILHVKELSDGINIDKQKLAEWSEEDKKLTDVNHEYFSELLENNNSKDINDYAYQVAYCMSHDWIKENATWDDVQTACKLGAEWNEKHHKSINT